MIIPRYIILTIIPTFETIIIRLFCACGNGVERRLKRPRFFLYNLYYVFTFRNLLAAINTSRVGRFRPT